MIKAALIDAENKQRDRHVWKWLRDLESSAYNLDELVDRVIKNPSLRKNEGCTGELRKLIPTCCRDSMLADETVFELGNISSRLEVLSKEISKLETRAPYRTGEKFQAALFMEESLEVSYVYRLS
ncbi:Hypothetical predicted protein [Olea europaea subsp. europaea]|uniref:Rx N-terminal domain-containing protein n=1 Tax=Olea europaea subsp. europaea TaxID=158383 RepID=A0A8S0QC90_OLEEU|nr:Hypothetical predicted protein [Olea europaea subsp. europaea]